MRKQTQLTQNWQFGWMDAPAAVPPEQLAMEPVTVPHVNNLEEPAREGCSLYRRQLTVQPEPGKRYFLCFDAVAGVARVFLNGTCLGQHRGGYSRFALEATKALVSGSNCLEVLADNTRYADVNPLMGDFTNFGGIYRPVYWLECQQTCFDPTYYGTTGLLIDTQENQVHLNAHVLAGEGAWLCYRITQPDGPSLEHTCPAEQPEVTLQIPQPHWWDGMADPYLYTCQAQLWRDGVLCDEVKLTFGLRRIRLTADRGFFLNDKPLRLNGVAKHQDFDGVGPAVTPEHIQKDFDLIRQVGANALRLSHYQHPQLTYDLCDRTGYVVWAEIPMLSMPEGNGPVVENARHQLRELILQNKHHPSICFWGIQNEIAMMGENLGMYRDVKALNALVKELDSSRISICANLFSVRNGSQLNFLTDAVGYNIYFGWYYGKLEDYAAFLDRFHKDNPQVPLCISEYGVDANPAYHTDTPECKDYTEEFQCHFHEQAYGAMLADEKLFGSFIWNMFDFSSAIRDEGGIKARNCKGLVSYDRTLKKDAFYYYKAQWSREPFVHITGSRYRNRCGETTTVKVYSNQPQVTLYVDGEAFDTCEGKGIFTFEHVPLTAEQTQLQAVAGTCRHRITLCRCQQPDPGYIYPQKGKGSMVTNWFRQQQASVDLFPEGYFSISDRMADLLADHQVQTLLEQQIPEIVHNPRARTMGGMTLMRVLDYNSDHITQDQVLALNAKLNAIAKQTNPSDGG